MRKIGKIDCRNTKNFLHLQHVLQKKKKEKGVDKLQNITISQYESLRGLDSLEASYSIELVNFILSNIHVEL